jgi:hypothetical protein
MEYNGEYYDNLIDCAAIKTEDGRVWTGKRHFHCIATIIQATGKNPHNAIQGFVTMRRLGDPPQGRFVTREEAFKMVKKTGQVTKFSGGEDCGKLYSEDLY